jgi:hypothetical protein
MMVAGTHTAPPDIALVPPSFLDFSTTEHAESADRRDEGTDQPGSAGPDHDHIHIVRNPGLAHRRSR